MLLAQHKVSVVPLAIVMLCVSLAIAAPQVVSADQPQMRTWTEARTNRTLQAELLGVQEGKVVLKRADGKVFEVPLERCKRPG